MSSADYLLVLGTFLSTLFSIIGVAMNKYRLILVGAILLLPICFNLNGTMSFSGIILLPIFHVFSMFALNQNYKLVAWLFLIPSILLTLVVLTALIIIELLGEGPVY